MLISKYRIHALLILVALVIVFFPLINQRPPKEKAEAATAAATAFLQRVDADQFAESWEIAATATKEKVSQEAWVEELATFRALTGPLVERAEEKMVLSAPAKDAPEGEYIVITYDSKFQKKAESSEIVSVMLGKDGEWRVAGYYLQ